MYNPSSKEVWKVYPLNYEFEGEKRLEVSNLGRVKSFTKLHPTGNIIKGSLQGGFPIIKIKLFKERTELQIAEIAKIQKHIDRLNARIKTLNKDKKLEIEVEQVRKQRDLQIQKRKKLNLKINKAREINVAFLIHKAVAELFLEDPKGEGEQFVIHKDFDKKNNEVSNLEYADRATLTKRTNLHPKTIAYNFEKEFRDQSLKVKNSKLTENEVLFIKKKLKKGISNKKLAHRFKISEMQIHRIKTGENWKHVELMEDILEKRKKKWQAT